MINNISQNLPLKSLIYNIVAGLYDININTIEDAFIVNDKRPDIIIKIIEREVSNNYLKDIYKHFEEKCYNIKEIETDYITFVLFLIIEDSIKIFDLSEIIYNKEMEEILFTDSDWKLCQNVPENFEPAINKININ